MVMMYRFPTAGMITGGFALRTPMFKNIGIYVDSGGDGDNWINVHTSYGVLRGLVKMILFAILNRMDIIIVAIVVLLILLHTNLSGP